MVIWGEFSPTLEDMVRLTKLPLFIEDHAMGIILEADGQMKLKYLTIVMVALKMSDLAPLLRQGEW